MEVFKVVAEAKSYFLCPIYENLASLVKNYHGIITSLLRNKKFQNELYVEYKKGHHQYYCNLDRMKSGG